MLNIRTVVWGGCLCDEIEITFSNCCLGWMFVWWNWKYIFELLFGVAVCVMKLKLHFRTVVWGVMKLKLHFRTVFWGGCLCDEIEVTFSNCCLGWLFVWWNWSYIFEPFFGVAACVMKLKLHFRTVVWGGCLCDEIEIAFSNCCLGWLFVWWNWSYIFELVFVWMFVWWNWSYIFELLFGVAVCVMRLKLHFRTAFWSGCLCDEIESTFSNCCLGWLFVWWNWNYIFEPLFGVAVCVMKLKLHFRTVVWGGCLCDEIEITFSNCCLGWLFVWWNWNYIFELLFGVNVCVMKLKLHFRTVVWGGCLCDEIEITFSNRCLGWLFVWWNWNYIFELLFGVAVYVWNWNYIFELLFGVLCVWWNWSYIFELLFGWVFVWNWNYIFELLFDVAVCVIAKLSNHCLGWLFVWWNWSYIRTVVWGGCLRDEIEVIFSNFVWWNWNYIFELLFVCLCDEIDVTFSNCCLEWLFVMKLKLDFRTAVWSGCLCDEIEVTSSNSCLGWRFVWWNQTAVWDGLFVRWLWSDIFGTVVWGMFARSNWVTDPDYVGRSFEKVFAK